jgi:hypothetical protein
VVIEPDHKSASSPKVRRVLGQGELPRIALLLSRHFCRRAYSSSMWLFYADPTRWQIDADAAI